MPRPLVLIDWHQTLSDATFWNKNVECTSSLFSDKERVNTWMRGGFTSEHICDWLSSISGVSSRELLSDLEKSCARFTISEDAIVQLQELKKNADIVLVSDNMDCFSRRVVPRLLERNFFTEIVVSSDVGKLKNDDNGRLLQDVMLSRNAQPSRTYLIDDSYLTCELFKKMGGQVLRVADPVDAVTKLTSLNVMIRTTDSRVLSF